MTAETDRLQVRAPAKLNLSLRVLRRREDRFHEIETFISPISLYDELDFETGGEGVRFICDDGSVPTGAENLVVRAATEFFGATGLRSGVTIRLRKRIPHGAGLGGGSSDAATTLLALNTLFATNLPREALAKLSESIGSDVPFFIYQSAAMCRGRGQLIEPEKLKESLSILLVKPEFAVATPWAYSRWKDSQPIPDVKYEPQEYHNHTFVNDLERPVFEKYVFLARLKMWLLGQPEVEIALMSGSGSTVFVVLKSPDAGGTLAERAKQELDPNLWTCACYTI
ncbi:MAG: 4-(cytidine 5'-diphospho)-2-C-methyl-D-erythritol kinase [Chthoniobacterales bacterium]